MKNNKFFLIGGIIIVLFIILGSKLFFRNNADSKLKEKTFPTEAVIPTVDSQVEVNLEKLASGHEVILTINNSLAGTESIDYELSYDTVDQGLQGVIGTLTGSQKKYEKKITLGTCSSGSCVYHKVKGKIRLNLRFVGSYGEKVFEKEY